MKLKLKQSIAGFTVVEMLVVIAIIGILAAIATPSWLSWLSRQRLNTAQAQTFTVLREAQANAKREKRIWQACFRDDGISVNWSVQSAVQETDDCRTSAVWNSLGGEDSDIIAIDRTNTNMRPSGANTYSVKFQYKGLLVETPSQLVVVDDGSSQAKITFGIRQNQGQQGVRDGSRRCVFIQTLLGAMRAGNDNECR